MAFNPLALLQQLSGAAPIPEEENEIVVEGQVPSRGRPMTQEPLFLPPEDMGAIQTRNVLSDDRAAPHPEQLKEILPRHGMFGMKGTLRDVLGTLGDAFLIGGGGSAMYTPHRQQERMGDAMFGAAENPMQAAERLAAAGFTKEAQDLIESTQRNEYNQGVLRSTEQNRLDQAGNRKEDNLQKLVNLTARRLQAAGDDPEKIAYALELATQDAARLQIDLRDLGISPDMTEDQRAVVAGGDMTVNQQVQVPFTERRVQVSERNATTGEKNATTARISANRPRNPPPRPRSDTVQEMFEEIGRIPENQRKQWQKDFYKRYTDGTDGSSGVDRRPVDPGASLSPRFR